MVSVSKEDYLKAVYALRESTDKRISTLSIANKLNISNAATTEMAKKLGEHGFLNYIRYKGVELTKKGEKLAIGIVRRHRLWELFLMKTLDLRWDEVHDEAEQLEHKTSDLLIENIDRYLGYPKFDPHGDPIPNKNGKLPKLPESVLLNCAEVGAMYKIVRVNHENSELIKYFSTLGLQLNQKIEVLDKLEFDNSVFIKLNGTIHTFSEKIAERLSVAKI